MLIWFLHYTDKVYIINELRFLKVFQLVEEGLGGISRDFLDVLRLLGV